MTYTQATPFRIELPTGLPVGTVNVYLFTHPEPVLLDTGLKSAESLAALKNGLAEHNLTLSDVTQVIISHPHIDHFGLAGTIAAQSDAQILILEQAVDWLTDYPRMWQTRTDYYANHLFPWLGLPDDIAGPINQYYKTVEETCDSVPAEKVAVFQANDTLMLGGQPWRVLHTPGHSSVLTCFHQADSDQLISTDMLLHVAPTPIVDPPPPGQTERQPSLPKFLESLTLVESLNLKTAYPGHGDIIDQPAAVIARQRARIDQRKQECLERIAAGETGVAQLLLSMYSHYPPQFRFAGLWMIIGYLDLLKAEGAIIEETVNGAAQYKPAN